MNETLIPNETVPPAPYPIPITFECLPVTDRRVRSILDAVPWHQVLWDQAPREMLGLESAEDVAT